MPYAVNSLVSDSFSESSMLMAEILAQNRSKSLLLWKSGFDKSTKIEDEERKKN